MDNRFDVIKLKIMRTANGYYVEHEADKVITSYSVTGKANDWAALNPALAGSFETPFTAETVKPTMPAASTDDAKTIDELTAKITALEAENQALLEKEAARTAQQEAAAQNEGETASTEMSRIDKSEKEAGKSSKSSKKSK